MRVIVNLLKVDMFGDSISLYVPLGEKRILRGEN